MILEQDNILGILNCDPTLLPQEVAEGQDTFLDADPSAPAVVDEYDPMKPNAYEEVKQWLRERDRRTDRNDDDRDR